jgi:hypothetical protein
MTQELRRLIDVVQREAENDGYKDRPESESTLEAKDMLMDAILDLIERVEKAEKDAARCKQFIDAMCEETFDTWTNGYRMQQVALNIQHAMNITAAMEASK